MLRSFLLSIFFHFFILLLLFYILPNFFAKQKNVEIAVDIVSLEKVPPILKPEDIVPAQEQKPVNISPKDNKIKKELIPPPFSPPKKQSQKSEKKSEKNNLKDLKKDLSEDKLKTTSDKSDLSDNEQGDSSDLSDLLEEVKRLQSEEKERINREEFIYGENLTAIEEANIRRQVNYCWTNIINKIFIKEDVSNIEIRVKVSFDSDGNVININFSEDMHEYMKIDNNLYRRILDSVRSTFLRCKRITAMPKAKYKYWKELEFVFKPDPAN